MEILTFTGGAFLQNTALLVCADGRTAILVDPGAATRDAIRQARTRRLDITAILLTHAHLDHIEGVALAKRETGVPIYLHPLDRVNYDAAPGQARAYGVPFEVPPPPDRKLAHADTLSFGGAAIDVVLVPGHAPGHVMFHMKEHRKAIVGDVVFAGSIGRTDLAGGDTRVLMDSIRRHVLTLPDETRLYPGHGPVTTVGRERATNPFLAPQYIGQLA